ALIVVPVLLRWARSIFYPLERMSRTIELVERGDMSARTGKTERDDEIARVAEHLDTLLDALQDRDRTLRDWANELDLKVAERTKELLAA
ncbi:HAMP domain-containing protein, partial [Acinetobacter baumannii]